MPEAVCPVCHEPIRITSEAIRLSTPMCCPECGSLLVVVDRNTLKLAEIPEGWEDSISYYRRERRRPVHDRYDL